ncbi:Pentatricopeptide repeat protein [Raphanus sativus]|nr:Pentatricopeptide repeat protein [Raphanus sativus]
MTTLLASKRLRPTLLLYHRFLINPKPFSSQQPQSPLITNQNDVVDDADVIRVLIGRRNDPVSALEYCSWVRPLNQIRHGGDLFWVLTHILATSPQTRDRARNLLVLFVSANPELPPSVIVKHLLDSAQRFDLGLDPHGFNYLLNAYTRNKRIYDALECFSLMVDRKVVHFVCYVNSLLSSLVKSNEIGEAKEIYNEMVEMGVSGDNVMAQLLMRGCLRERRPVEAVRIFRRSSRYGLMYSLAVQAACKIPDLGMALGLLGEMREELGVCGSHETRVNLRRTLRLSYPAAHLSRSSRFTATSPCSSSHKAPTFVIPIFSSSYSSSSEKHPPSSPPLTRSAALVGQDDAPINSSSKVLTLPTVLTLGRVAAVPLLVSTFYVDGWWGTTATTSIFVAAAVTDWLDGYLARKMKLGSAFGAFLDPVADKLMVAATLILLCTKPIDVAVLGPVPWLLTVPSIAIIGREITMSAVREWAASQNGKLLEMTALTILLASRDSSVGWLAASGAGLLYVSAGLSVWSLAVYMRKIWKVLLK